MKQEEVMFYVLWDKNTELAMTDSGKVRIWETAEEVGKVWRGLTDEEQDRWDIMAVVEFRQFIPNSNCDDVFDECYLVYCDHFYSCEKCNAVMNWDELNWVTSSDGLCNDCYEDYAHYCEDWEEEIAEDYPHLAEFLNAK